MQLNAMLKMTVVNLDLISNIDMYLFIKKDMRVRVIYIVQRYSKANNNKGKDKSYDKDKPSKRIY